MRPAVSAAKPKAPQAGLLFERDRKFDKLRPAVHRGLSSNSPEHGFWGDNAHGQPGVAHTVNCNQGKSKAGVQLDLLEALRESPDAVAGVVRAVRSVLMQAAGISS